jgi:tRNA (guanine-N7-)-methyltransferase
MAVDNQLRTDQHFAAVAERRRDLYDRFSALFEPGDTFVWEVGCGHGHFLVDYARVSPARRCIGIDIASERIERATRKRDRAQLANLHFLRAEARLFLDALPAEISIADVFVLFPDPWPKVRHHKHRIMQADFLTHLARRATPDCRLHFRTDHRDYFSATAKLVEAHPDWQVIEGQWPFEFETVFQSKSTAYQSLIARRRP